MYRLVMFGRFRTFTGLRLALPKWVSLGSGIKIRKLIETDCILSHTMHQLAEEATDEFLLYSERVVLSRSEKTRKAYRLCVKRLYIQLSISLERSLRGHRINCFQGKLQYLIPRFHRWH